MRGLRWVLRMWWYGWREARQREYAEAADICEVVESHVAATPDYEVPADRGAPKR